MMGARPRIMCDVCGREVERIEMIETPWLRERQLTVFCHGEAETMTVTDKDLYQDGPFGPLQQALGGGAVGHAFSAKRIA